MYVHAVSPFNFIFKIWKHLRTDAVHWTFSFLTGTAVARFDLCVFHLLYFINSIQWDLTVFLSFHMQASVESTALEPMNLRVDFSLCEIVCISLYLYTLKLNDGSPMWLSHETRKIRWKNHWPIAYCLFHMCVCAEYLKIGSARLSVGQSVWP